MNRTAVIPVLILSLLAAPWLCGHEAHVHPATPTDAAPAGQPGELPPPLRASPTVSDRAIEQWTRQTSAHPDDADAWVHLGNALMQKSREQAAHDLYARAEAAFDRALTLATNHVQALVGLAWVHNTKHEFEAGKRFAHLAIAADSRNQDAYALLGDAAIELGDYDEALEFIQKALDIAPNLSSYSRAAHLLWLTGDIRQAKRLMQKAIAAGGPYAEHTAWCRAEVGLMLFNEGALLPAEQQLETALAITPNNAHVLAALGRVRAARGDLARAIGLYERAVAVVPQHASLAALVDLYALSGDEEKACQSFQRVLDYHAGHQHGHDSDHDVQAAASNPAAADGSAETAAHAHGNAELARFLADHDRDLPRALAEAEAAYRIYKNIGVTATLAWCQHKNGRSQEARRTMLKALRWRTPDAGLYYRAGVILAAAGDKPGGQELLYQALSLNPNFDPLQTKLASARLKELAAELAAEHRQLTAGARP